MDLSALFKRAGQVAADNSPAILTAIGVTGTLTTAYLAAKAAFKSVDVLKEAEEDKREHFFGDQTDATGEAVEVEFEGLTTQDQFEAVWSLYVPAAASAALTVAAIICSQRISDRRAAAMASAYSVVEKSYAEYRAKNLAKVGKKKEQEVRDAVAQDLVTDNPPSKSEIILVNNGTVLCLDTHSMRYFTGDMETLRKAENDINWQILNEGNASLTDFWDKIGLAQTKGSDELGWNTDAKFEIEFSTALSDDGRPCITVSFKNTPVPRYYRNAY